MDPRKAGRSSFWVCKKAWRDEVRNASCWMVQLTRRRTLDTRVALVVLHNSVYRGTRSCALCIWALPFFTSRVCVCVCRRALCGTRMPPLNIFHNALACASVSQEDVSVPVEPPLTIRPPFGRGCVICVPLKAKREFEWLMSQSKETLVEYANSMQIPLPRSAKKLHVCPSPLCSFPQ